LIGLDNEWAVLQKSLGQLFFYDPRTQSNTELGQFPASYVLTGPPGTGKSSLLIRVLQESARLAKLTGTACTTVQYDASKFSSYFGKTTRILQRELERVRDPRGVGIFIIEDADMVLQSRDEVHKSHGLQEVQQYLMNEISGIKNGSANWLAYFTTNRTKDIDESMRSRFGCHQRIDPFDRYATHSGYFSQYTPHLEPAAQERLAQYSFDSGLRGRSLTNALTAARSAVTLALTDEEIIARRRKQPVEPPSESVLRDALTAARITVQGTQDS
jgi:SpoVK/Ycf46/Vps4 family AAA+-type ATPase